MEEQIRQAAEGSIKMLEFMIDALIDEENELVPKMAKMLKRLFNSLVAEGFTDEQAMDIVQKFSMTGGGK